MDEWIKLKDMLSSLKLENWYLFNPKKEQWIIKALNNPSRLRKRFRSKTLDLVLQKIIDESIAQHQGYISIRHKIFPYIPKQKS
jgi:chorismate mutase